MLAQAVAEALPHAAMMIRAPHPLAGACGQRCVQRPTRRRCQAPLRAAHESPIGVRLVELEAVDTRSDVSGPRPQEALEDARDDGEGCIISRRPTSPLELASRPGTRCRTTRAGGAQSRPHSQRARPRRLSTMGFASGVNVLGPLHQPVRTHDEPNDSCPRDEAGSVGDRLGPVRDVGGRLCALRTALHACAPLRARMPASVGQGQNRARSRPPVPAEAVVRTNHVDDPVSERESRKRQISPSGYAGSPANPDTPTSRAMRS